MKIIIAHKTEITVSEIIYLQALSNYTYIVTIDKYYISCRHLKIFEGKIGVDNFLRINRGILVNKAFVRTIDLRKSKPFVVLSNSKEISISRRKLPQIIENSVADKRRNTTYLY